MAEKKKRPAPKKTAKKPSANRKKGKHISVDKSEMIRWALGFLAFFLILTFFTSMDNGSLGSGISEVLKGLFGPMYYIIPFIMLVMVFTWENDRANDNIKVKYLLYSCEFVFISVFVQAICEINYPIRLLGRKSFFEIIGKLYESGIDLESSGAVCGTISLIFTDTIGEVASIILASLGIFICTVSLFGISPKEMIKSAFYFICDSIDQLRESRAANADEEYYDDEDEEEEEEEYVAPVPTKREKKEKEKKKFVAALPPEPEEPMDEPMDQPMDEPMDEPMDAPAEEQPAEEPFVDEVFPEEVIPPAVPTEEPVAPPDLSEISFDLDEEEELCLEPIEDTPYVFPPISLLTPNEKGLSRPSGAEVERTSRKLEEVLASFNVKAKVIDCTYGPTVTRYELAPETGVRVKSIVNLADDIALHLAATAIRIENIPGKAAVGIEIPNRNTSTVRLRELIDNATFRDAKSRLFTALGEDVAGNPVYLDVAKMPHLLVAGATGQGKSVCINSIIISLLYRNHPNDVKLILIDPKTVEFSDYKDIPHLLVPVINDPKSAAGTLNWACSEMEKRYKLIQEVGARDLAGYNTAVADDPERELLPQIVIFIDEFADLMMTAPDDVETSVCRLAQKARAAGMHLVIGTQRPSVDVITGLIKANIPSRIALTTTSQVDSRTILDMTGAEKLLGKGDMLYYPVGAMKPIRVQGAFVDGKTEVQAVTQFIKEAAHAQYDESIMSQIEQEAKMCGLKGKKAAAAMEAADEGDDKTDPMFMDAVGVAIECGTVSTSLLQRRLSLGYSRAARIIDKMERKGFIGEFDAATKKRAILITAEQYAELKLNGDTKKEDSADE